MNLQLMAYELIQIMTGGIKHFTFFPIDIFISNLSYICILEGTEFLPLIMYFKLEQTYMYTICIFDLKNCYCYYKIFEVY